MPKSLIDLQSGSKKKKISLKKEKSSLKKKKNTVFSDLGKYLPKSSSLKKIKSLKISPKKIFIKKEIMFFISIGVVAIIILQLVGFMGKGTALIHKLKLSAESIQNVVNETKNAAKEGDLLGVKNNIESIQKLFESLENELSLNEFMEKETSSFSYTINTFIDLGKMFAGIGEELTLIGKEYEKILTQMLGEMNDGMRKNYLVDVKELEEEVFYLITGVLVEAEEKLKSIDVLHMPAKVEKLITTFYEKKTELLKNFDLVRSFISLAYKILGDDHLQRYVIFFQNEYEIRPTGGFLGSYVLLSVNDGDIEYSFHDIYENNGQYISNIKAPPGIREVIDMWYLHDSNYYPDFPASAQTMMWFLDQEKGPTVNGVFTINQRVAKSILDIVGPIYLDDYGIEIRSDNFSLMLSYMVEAKLEEGITPKKVIEVLMGKIIEKMKEGGIQKQIMPLIINLFQEKHINAYFDDEELQTMLDLWGMSHAIHYPQGDYLQVVHTSLSGNKSDGFVKQSIAHTSRISDERVVNILEINRLHQWSQVEDSMFEKLYDRFGSGKVKKSDLREILGHGANRSFVRIYVPKGSVLLRSEGIDMEEIELVEELGKTVFQFISPRIYAGENSKLRFQYTIPKQHFSQNQYSFFLEKQMGFGCSDIIKQVFRYPEKSWKIESSFPSTLLRGKENNVRFEMNVCEDQEMEVGFVSK